jgi:hypothetical protein
MLTAEDGSIVYQVGQVSSGKKLLVRVSDGQFDVIVE